MLTPSFPAPGGMPWRGCNSNRWCLPAVAGGAGVGERFQRWIWQRQVAALCACGDGAVITY